MQVTAFSTPAVPDWRWRITYCSGEILEESRNNFPTIAAAVAAGTKRLVMMNVVDRSMPPPRWRTTVWGRRPVAPVPPSTWPVAC